MLRNTTLRLYCLKKTLGLPPRRVCVSHTKRAPGVYNCVSLLFDTNPCSGRPPQKNGWFFPQERMFPPEKVPLKGPVFWAPQCKIFRAPWTSALQNLRGNPKCRASQKKMPEPLWKRKSGLYFNQILGTGVKRGQHLPFHWLLFLGDHLRDGVTRIEYEECQCLMNPLYSLLGQQDAQVRMVYGITWKAEDKHCYDAVLFNRPEACLADRRLNFTMSAQQTGQDIICET